MPARLDRDVARRVQRWRRILGLGRDWQINVRVLDAPEHAEDDRNDATAYIKVEPGYFFANMTVNGWHVDKDTDLDHVIVHELVHVLLQPVCTIVESAMGEHMSEVAEQNMEALCERIARAVLRADRGR